MFDTQLSIELFNLIIRKDIFSLKEENNIKTVFHVFGKRLLPENHTAKSFTRVRTLVLSTSNLFSRKPRAALFAKCAIKSNFNLVMSLIYNKNNMGLRINP